MYCQRNVWSSQLNRIKYPFVHERNAFALNSNEMKNKRNQAPLDINTSCYTIAARLYHVQRSVQERDKLQK